MNDKYLSVVNGIVENEHLYVVDIDTWFLIDCNLQTDTCRVIADIQPPDFDGLCWVVKIVHIGREFFCILRNSKRIIVADEDGKVSFYGNEYEIGANNWYLNIDACLCEKKLYLLPYYVNGSIKVFDLDEHIYLEEVPMVELLMPIDQTYYSKIIRNYVHREDDAVVIFCMKETGMVYMLNLLEKKAEKLFFLNQFHFDMAVGNFSYIVLNEVSGYRIIEYNRTADEIKEYDFRKNFLNDNSTKYKFLAYANDCFWAISDDERMVELIYRNEKLEHMDFLLKLKYVYEVRKPKHKYEFSRILVQDKNMYMLPFSTNGLLEIDMPRRKMKFHMLKISSKDIAYKHLEQSKIIQEDTNFSIKELLSFIFNFQIY